MASRPAARCPSLTAVVANADSDALIETPCPSGPRQRQGQRQGQLCFTAAGVRRFSDTQDLLLGGLSTSERPPDKGGLSCWSLVEQATAERHHG